MMRLNRVIAVLALLSALISLTYVVIMTKIKGRVSISAAKNRSYSRQTMIAQEEVVEEQQWKRMQDLQDGCNNAPKKYPRTSALSHLIVDDTHHLVYCYIPKVACTSWKKIMATLNGYPNQTDSAVHKRDKTKLLKYLTEYPPSKINTILQSYVKFMFVREPFERLLSAFKSKFLGGDKYIVNKYGREIIRLFRKNTKSDAQTSGADVTFAEFIDYVIFLSAHRRRFNEHWRAYDSLCYPCDINYDFIGHYETMAEDAQYILKRAGVEDLVSFPPFLRTDTTDELRSYYSQIPRNALLQLKRIYQRDLDLFGYRLPGPLLRRIHDDSENTKM